MKNYYIKYNWVLSFLMIWSITFLGYAQKNKDIIPTIDCIKYTGNGLYQASFGYINPTKKEVIIDENASIIKFNNGKKLAKGLNKFKPGANTKVFTKEFGTHDFVVWTIISNGQTHEVVVNANGPKCEPDDGFIFPVIGNGKSYNIIGQELTALCDDVAGETPSDLIFQVNGNKILVEIVPIDGKMQEVLNLLQQTPFNVPASDFLLDLSEYNNLSAIDVYLDKYFICLLNNYSDIINFARPVYPAYNNSGGVVTQGDAAQTSNKVRESFRLVNNNGEVLPVDGSGIKIGVLSDSYDMSFEGAPASQDVYDEELPEGVEVLKDNDYNSTDEGRAMLQIIHDVAPGAGLAFHTATASPRQFEVGFQALRDAGCRFIVDDITFITEPFFGTGRISQAIQSFVSEAGNFHFTSAGNIANKGYQATFNSSSNLPNTNFIPPNDITRAHVFGTNADGSEDYLQKISVVPGTYLIALQWKENAASQINELGAADDLDIYIVDDFGNLLVGNNRVNVNGDPTEIIVFKSIGTGEANILITSAKGATNVPFRYIAFRTSGDDSTPDGLKFVEYFGGGAPTVSGHAMTPESVTVGAVDYRNKDNPVAEPFSSYAGLLTDGVTLEIDMYAPDGGNTTSKTIGQLATCDTCDKDVFLNFYGTSASAPHAAAAMALLQSAIPVWIPDGSFTDTDVLNTFKNTATTFAANDGTVGGFINTLEAFKSIASQTAKITSLTVTSGIPSAEPIEIIIIGDFFPDKDSSPYPVKIYFDDEELAYTVNPDGSITTTIPAFVGNPDLKIYTEPKPGTTGNGGFSDPVKILPEGKIALNIIPDNLEVEYGQDINLTDYTVEGLPEDTDFTKSFPEIFADLGLPEVKLSSYADSTIARGEYPIVSKYRIEPSFGGVELSEELQDKYQINFIKGYVDPNPEIGAVGYLAVNKKDLTITSEDVTYTYGEAIDIPLLYEYNMEGISDESGFRSAIYTAHASDFKDGLPNKFKAVVSKFKAVVSDYDLLNLLDGGSWSASERTIQNKFKAVVSTMNIIDLDNEDLTNYIEARTAFDDGETNKFKAVVSKFKAVVSAEDLFNGDIDLGIENKFKAVVSKFKAVVSDEDPERPYNAYEKVFTIIDAEDAPPEDGSDDERAISQIYSLNMITGLDVTSGSDNHYVYPGAFLNKMAANFNINYIPGRLIILPKELIVSTESFAIPYGEILTVEKLMENTNFEGWAFEGEYQDSVESVFPEGVPFYFVKDQQEYDLSELKELGDYEIKIREPQNYTISYPADNVYGTLTIEAAPLIFAPENLTIDYGVDPVVEPNFGPFAYDEDAGALTDAYYYFMKEGDAITKYTVGGSEKMGVGTYGIYLNDDASDNYLIVHDENRGVLTISEATLTFNPDAIEIRYGEDPVVTPNFSPFAYDENAGDLTDAYYYFMKEGDDVTQYTVGGSEPMGVGVYEIFINDYASDNYKIEQDVNRGKLTINPLEVIVRTTNMERLYGNVILTGEMSTEFDEFAHSESTSDVFPGGVPYYFVDTDLIEYEPGDQMDVGDYDIKIKDVGIVNYTFTYDSSYNSLRVNKNTLTALIDDLILNQGDIPVFSSEISGYMYGETEEDVFPEGIPYYFVDEYGVEGSNTDVGVFNIKIMDPKNYVMDTNEDATLFINPFDNNVQKIRIYADCVSYNGPGDYTVIYRYENDNDYPIYVAVGPDNYLTGNVLSGILPTSFMPGSGTFEIGFDGNQLVWNLTTYDSLHKSSVSSASTSGTGECDAKLDGSYTIGPNPVTDVLTITQNIAEQSKVDIYNMYGQLVIDGPSFNSSLETKTVDMFGLKDGLYIVQIVSTNAVRTYNIIKQ